MRYAFDKCKIAYFSPVTMRDPQFLQIYMFITSFCLGFLFDPLLPLESAEPGSFTRHGTGNRVGYGEVDRGTRRTSRVRFGGYSNRLRYHTPGVLLVCTCTFTRLFWFLAQGYALALRACCPFRDVKWRRLWLRLSDTLAGHRLVRGKDVVRSIMSM